MPLEVACGAIVEVGRGEAVMVPKWPEGCS